GDTDRRACVPAFVAENFDHQVGSAIHDLRSINEIRIRVDKAAEPHDPHDLVEVAKRKFDLCQEVDGTGAGRLLAVFDRHGAAEFAFGDELAVGAKADLARYDQERSAADKTHIIGDRGSRCRQHNAEICEFFLN